MEHDTTLLLTISIGLGLAFVLGFVASRLRLPPLVGYLLAGIAMGPFTPGFVGDAGLAGQLAEIGVILLMFGVGLHFSLDDLRAVRWIAVPGAIGQIAAATIIGLGVSLAWGWSLGAGIVFGLCLSVASTVVLLKSLEERNALNGVNGRIAVGWLVVEDLVMILALVLIPAFASSLGGGGGAPASLGTGLLVAGATVLKVGVFLAIMLVVGPRILPLLLREVARLGSRELFTLAILAAALGIAVAAAKVFEVSFALGAFCAGMVMAKSEYSHRAATDSLPLQDAFAVLFFVSVGMLFDPSVLVREPGAVAATLLIIVLGKTAIAIAIVLALGYPAGTATMVGASLAQIGEFSFILVGLGISQKLLPSEARDLVLAGAILSIILNPLAFKLVGPLTRGLTAMPRRIGRTARRQMKFARLERRLEAEQVADDAALTRSSLTPDEVGVQFPIFGHLAPDARTGLAALFVARRAAPGERLIRKGDPADEIFFIETGEVEVSLPDRAIRLGRGEFFGEMGVLLGRARTADVTALDFCDLQALSRRNLLHFLDQHPDLTAAIGDVAELRSLENRKAT